MARPKKEASEKYRTPASQFGRIPDAEWNEIQAAVAASGLESLVAWALPVLLSKAMRERKAREQR